MHPYLTRDPQELGVVNVKRLVDERKESQQRRGDDERNGLRRRHPLRIEREANRASL